MSFDLVPQLIIVISLSIIMIIFGKNIPKIKELDDISFSDLEEKREKKFYYLYNRLKKRISKKEYQKRINLLWKWFEKFLRKIRIGFLKFDNKIVSLLKKLREKNIEANVDKNIETDNIEQYDTQEEEKEAFDFQKQEVFTISEKENDENRGNNNEVENEIKDDKKCDILDKEVENGNLNLDKENTKGKEKEYINMIIKNPIDIKAYWKLGIVYSRRKNYHDAISCFRQITKIDPTYIKAKKKIVDLIERMRKKEKDEIKNKQNDFREKEAFVDNEGEKEEERYNE